MRIRFIILIAGISFYQTNAQTTMNAVDSSLTHKLISGRTFFDGLGQSYLPASEVAIKEEIIAGVPCYWFTSHKPLSNKLVIYLHGGGFAWGSINSHKALVSHITKHTQVRILFVDYALAPEHPYPHGVNDVMAVYEAIAKQEPNAEIQFIGDSAGGGLAVSAIRQLQQSQVRQPGGVVLISPWLNLNADTPSYRENALVDPILTAESVREYAVAYNPTNVIAANPCTLEFKHFPRVLIILGSREILLDDSQRFYDHVRHVQPDATLHIVQNQTHVWVLTDISHQDSRAALDEIKEFVSGPK